MADDGPRFVEHGADGDVHVLRIANPPVNTLRTEVRAGLLDGLRAAGKAGARALRRLEGAAWFFRQHSGGSSVRDMRK